MQKKFVTLTIYSKDFAIKFLRMDFPAQWKIAQAVK
jgi:hypothetical protein